MLANSPSLTGTMLSLLAVPQDSAPCRARTDCQNVARLGAKSGSLPSETSISEDLLDQRPAPRLVVSHELGKETGSPGQHQGGLWV